MFCNFQTLLKAPARLLCVVNHVCTSLSMCVTSLLIILIILTTWILACWQISPLVQGVSFLGIHRESHTCQAHMFHLGLSWTLYHHHICTDVSFPFVSLLLHTAATLAVSLGPRRPQPERRRRMQLQLILQCSPVCVIVVNMYCNSTLFLTKELLLMNKIGAACDMSIYQMIFQI